MSDTVGRQGESCAGSETSSICEKRADLLEAHADSILACDFLTVDTVWLRRFYALVFLSIGGRGIEYFACTSNPDTRFLIHDRDSKFPRTLAHPRERG